MTLASWISLGLVVLGVVLLVFVALPLLPKLGRLKRAADVAKGKAAEAQALQAELEQLQTQMIELQTKVESLRPAR